ncbi:hypothetical protein D046_0522B, partial [Vibrio parahaemolyticus V-223/04]
KALWKNMVYLTVKST